MNSQQQDARDRAVKVLTHYITLLLEKSGSTPDNDVRVEVEGIVDDIILAATLPAMTAHEAAVADLRRGRSGDELKAIADNPDPRD